MNAIGLQMERLLTESAIGGVDTMTPVDPWTQYGPAGILLLAFSGAITVLWRWAAPLIAAWVLSRVALTDAVRRTHEETSAANELRFRQSLETFQQIQKHVEHLDKRVDRIAHVIGGNCGKGEMLDSDDEIKSTEHGT